MYDVFYQETTYKLCVIQDSYGIVGVACLQEQYEAFKDAHGLFVVFTQLDNTKGLLKRVTEEWDRIADTEGFSYVRFNFIRHGWAKLMDKYPGEGYNVVEYVGEKVYGRWRR